MGKNEGGSGNAEWGRRNLEWGKEKKLKANKSSRLKAESSKGRSERNITFLTF